MVKGCTPGGGEAQVPVHLHDAPYHLGVGQRHTHGLRVRDPAVGVNGEIDRHAPAQIRVRGEPFLAAVPQLFAGTAHHSGDIHRA